MLFAKQIKLFAKQKCIYHIIFLFKYINKKIDLNNNYYLIILYQCLILNNKMLKNQRKEGLL